MDNINYYLNKIYKNDFLPKYLSNQITIDRDIFSNSEILGLLESEKDSFNILTQHIKNLNNSIAPFKRILIIGSGSGRLGAVIRKQYPFSYITDIDINAKSVKRLKEKIAKDKYRIAVVADAHNLPFSNNSFDLVVAYSSMRYMGNINKVINEFVRTVKKGGSILIAEGNKLSTMKQIIASLTKNQLNFKKKVYKDILLPKLTFFYYILERAKHDQILMNLLNSYRTTQNKSIYQAIFELAGNQSGKIYTCTIKE